MKSHSNIEPSIWSSRWVFFMAMTAAAVGLGNIWKFPFIMAENGGGAFVLIYLFSIVLIGVPLMLCEVVIGHLGRANPVASLQRTALRSNASKHWAIAAYVGPLIGLLICVLLTVVTGWAINYLITMFQGGFVYTGKTEIVSFYNDAQLDTESSLIYQSAFLFALVVILGLGVNRGLAKGLGYFVPMSLLILLILLVFSLTSGSLQQSIDYLFAIDFQKISINSWLLAIEHAFYTLSIGIGALMAFGAYVPRRGAIGPIVISVALMDTLISLLIGLVVLPTLLSNQVSPASGYDLLFVSLPLAYGNILGGQYLGGLFYLFVLFTAVSSALVLLEPAIAWYDETFAAGRWSASVVIGFVVWLLSIASWEQWQLLPSVADIQLNLFDVINVATAKFLLPFSALLITFYVGWVVTPVLVRYEIANTGIGWLYIWYFLIRYVVPPTLITVFVLHQFF